MARMLRTSPRPVGAQLTQLTSLGFLVLDRDGLWTLTAVGERIMQARANRDWRPLTALYLRAGSLDREVLAFLAEADTQGDHAVLRYARARTVCPALAAVVSWVPQWRMGNLLRVPLDALQTAMAVAAMDLAEHRPDWVADRERVGQRAEAYSLRLERERHGIAAVLHTSREEGDRFGYDLEEVSNTPSRLIECKGSRGSTLRFVISAHELGVAAREGNRYEVQYWGEIDLSRVPDREYRLLREAGYPKVIDDPAKAVDDRVLVAECASWNVTEGA